MNTDEWRGVVGDSWSAEWQRTDRSFAGLASQLDAAILDAAPAGGGQALDVGCGAGATALALAAARPDLAVTGLDISPALIEIARARANARDLDNLSFAVADLNAPLPTERPADLICSRHGVMFADDPAAMFATVRAAARPGGRLIFSCFRTPAENPWATELVAAVVGAMPPPPTGYVPGPFAFADPAFVTGLLTAAGWRAIDHRPVDYDYIAGEGADPITDAAEFFGRIGPVARAMRDAAAPAPPLHDRLRAALADYRTADRVALPAAAWIWSATA